MRRRRSATASLAVSLFPFLAVLICTMGVLIVMLVLAVKSSTVKAREHRQQHEEKLHAQREAMLDQLDLEEFRVRELATMRPEVEQRLTDQRLRRSHLEDEIRKLIEQADQIRRQMSQLGEDRDLAQSSRASDTEKIEELEKQIAERLVELDNLREEVAGRPQMYSIVPTRTAGGTLQRPIYVECTPAGLYLRPSGIHITLAEFTRPVLPGNPLDAALLATREYWNKYEAGTGEGEPYPLLVVRPGGATAYALARRAMQSWDEEFGYELVEASKQLDWGTVDENLNQAVQKAISLAKQEQQHHVAYGRAQWMFDPAGGNGIDGRSGYPGTEPGGSGPGTTGTAGSDGTGQFTQSGTGDGTTGEQGDAGAGEDPGSGFDSADNSGQFAAGGGEWQASGDGDMSGGDLEQQTASGNGAFQPSSSNPLRYGQNPMGDPAALSGGMSGASSSLAQQRGSNWALPTRTPGATPYRRPIRVECAASHYLVYPGDPEKSPARVAIEGRVDPAIDQLVNQIWKQIEGWGMAEIGGYWKPVLRISTASGEGVRRAEELERKLEGSGIEIERLWR